MPKKDVSLSLRLPADLKAELQRLADEDGRTLSDYVVRTLKKAVQDATRDSR